jgi:hypothetical protein
VRIDGPAALLLAGLLLRAIDSVSAVIVHWLVVALPIYVAQIVGLAVQFMAIIALGRVVPGVSVDGTATAVWGAVLPTMQRQCAANRA